MIYHVKCIAYSLKYIIQHICIHIYTNIYIICIHTSITNQVQQVLHFLCHSHPFSPSGSSKACEEHRRSAIVAEKAAERQKGASKVEKSM